MRPGGSMPHSQRLSNNPYPEIFFAMVVAKLPVEFWGPVWCLWTNMFLTVYLTPNHQAEGPFLVGCYDCLFNILVANFCMLRAIAPRPIRRMRHAVVTGTHGIILILIIIIIIIIIIVIVIIHNHELGPREKVSSIISPFCSSFIPT